MISPWYVTVLLVAPVTTSDAISALGSGYPVRVRDALAAGITRSAIRAALASGSVVRVRHGCLLSSRDNSERTSEQIVDRIHAAVSRIREDVIVSHASAALLHGLPMSRASASSLIHLTSPAKHRRSYPGVKIHAAHGFREDDVISIDGLRVTSLLRTAVDVARGLPLADALIPLDAAVRRLVIQHPDQRPGLADHDRVEVADIVANVNADLVPWGSRLATCIGVRELRRAIEHVSPLAESPLESGSRGVFFDGGIMPVALQYRFVDAFGTHRRSDFLLEEGVIGEADGLVKYEGAEGAERLRAEKHRDVASAGAGLHTIRWTAVDVWVRPQELLRRVRREMGLRREAGTVSRGSARNRFPLADAG